MLRVDLLSTPRSLSESQRPPSPHPQPLALWERGAGQLFYQLSYNTRRFLERQSRGLSLRLLVPQLPGQPLPQLRFSSCECPAQGAWQRVVRDQGSGIRDQEISVSRFLLVGGSVQSIVLGQAETMDFWLPKPEFTQNFDHSLQFPSPTPLAPGC